MSADLQPHPAMQEVAWVHRPVVVTLGADGAALSIVNRRSFTDLSDLAASVGAARRWRRRRSRRTRRGDVAPAATLTLPLPCAIPASSEAFLTIRWTQRRATPWAPAGHLVAWDQLPLAHPDPPRPHQSGVPPTP